MIREFIFPYYEQLLTNIKSRQPGVVVATDITLDRLSSTINEYQLTSRSEAVLINAEGQTFAYKDPENIELNRTKINSSSLSRSA